MKMRNRKGGVKIRKKESPKKAVVKTVSGSHLNFSIKNNHGFDEEGNIVNRNPAFFFNVLSNMSPHVVSLDEASLPEGDLKDLFIEIEAKKGIGEVLFHYVKFKLAARRCSADERKRQLDEHAESMYKGSAEGKLDCKQIKAMGGKGKKKGFLLTPKELEYWEQINVLLQKAICSAKLEQYPEVKKVLELSGERLLIHPAFRGKVDKWTAIYCSEKQIIVKGQNEMGNCWMEERQRLQENEK